VKPSLIKLVVPAAILLVAAAAFAADDVRRPVVRPAPQRQLEGLPDSVDATAEDGGPMTTAAEQEDDAPATGGTAGAPTTAPATRPVGRVQALFEQLLAAESGVRERARVELMGLSRDDLETLRHVVQTSGPPTAQQAAVLHDIVVHVFLATDPYEASRPPAGFLGVRLPMDPAGGIALPEDTALKVGDPDTGVPIAEAIPGFCGFRHLQAGDVVLGVDAPQWTRTPNSPELIDAISQTPPGRKITLHVLRQGRVMQIALRLSARPRVANDPLATKLFIDDRQQRAEEYWHDRFSPLLDRGMS
jgi:hypothetical protein